MASAMRCEASQLHGFEIDRALLKKSVPARRELNESLEEEIMKYICLVYGEEEKIGAMTDDECMEYDAAIRKSGSCIASEALQRVKTAKTVRVRCGKISVVDGPFAETKEQFAGFYLIEAANMNSAVAIASKIPPAQVGCIEVRPIRELVNTRGERRRAGR
jgi:hypothetical protein